MKSFLAVLNLPLLLMPVSSFAYKVPAEWAKCERDDQCVIADAGCGVERAANRNFSNQVQDNMASYAYECLKPLEWHSSDTVAKCESQRCILSPPGGYSGGMTPIDQ